MANNPLVLLNQTSTNYDGRYDINTVVDTVELEMPDGKIIQILDVLDARLTKLLNSISEWTPYVYDGTEHITTISYKAYGNTTLWWIIMMYNGFMHPLEIEPGINIKIPTAQSLSEFFIKVIENKNIGRVVEI